MKRQKYWETKQFKELESHWYDLLQLNGFQDHEKKVKGEMVLRQNAGNSYRGAEELEREMKALYYSIVKGKASTEEQFKDEVEKLVMHMRGEGIKIAKICEELRDMGERCHRQTVRQIIQKWEIRWGIRPSSKS